MKALQMLLLAVFSFGLGFQLSQMSARQQIETLVRADTELKTADAHLKESCSEVRTINESLLGQMSGATERMTSATAQLKKDASVMSFCKEHLEKELKGNQ